jgi:hypothetical protein
MQDTDRVLALVQLSANCKATPSWLEQCWKLLTETYPPLSSPVSQATLNATAELLVNPTTAAGTFNRLSHLIPNRTERLALLRRTKLPTEAIKPQLAEEIKSDQPWSPDHAEEVLAAVSALEPLDQQLSNAALLNGCVTFEQELRQSNKPHTLLFWQLQALEIILGSTCTPATHTTIQKASAAMNQKQLRDLAQSILSTNGSQGR